MPRASRLQESQGLGFSDRRAPDHNCCGGRQIPRPGGAYFRQPFENNLNPEGLVQHEHRRGGISQNLLGPGQGIGSLLKTQAPAVREQRPYAFSCHYGWCRRRSPFSLAPVRLSQVSSRPTEPPAGCRSRCKGGAAVSNIQRILRSLLGPNPIAGFTSLVSRFWRLLLFAVVRHGVKPTWKTHRPVLPLF